MVAVAAVAVIVAVLLSGGTPARAPGGAGHAVSLAQLPGLQTGPAPWQPEDASLPARLAALQLPPNGNERYHIHAHLAIFVNGQPVTVPADVGIVPGQLVSPVHTHDSSGVIHVEAARASDAFTLGAFLDIWGVRFTGTQLGAYANHGTAAVHVYINGTLVADPGRHVLRPHDNIVIGYGTPGSFPRTVPFTWPAGL